LKTFKTLEWIGDVDGCLELTDQRKLPSEFTAIRCRTVEQLYNAIKTLAVRGAPAIGVAAAFGVCLAAQ
jgi:methylthioribose-1-phosphate isomerase